MSGSIRIILLNLNHVSTSIDELYWWAGDQIRESIPVAVFLFTEPVTGQGGWPREVPHYTVSPKSPVSELTTNKHYHTTNLTYDNGRGFEASPVQLEPHHGITFSRISSSDPEWKTLYLGSTYVPRDTCPEAYTQSLFDSLSKCVLTIQAEGGIPLIGMDCNCGFKHRHHMPTSRNYRYLSDFMTRHDLIILNWEPEARGFYTRTRGLEKSQLDIYVAPRAILKYIKKINIREDIHFNSDHCAVELVMSISPRAPPSTVHRPQTWYQWTEACKIPYTNALGPRLRKWDRKYSTPPTCLPGTSAAVKVAGAAAMALGDIIVSSYKSCVRHKVVRGGSSGPGKVPSRCPAVEERVAARNRAREVLQQARESGSPLTSPSATLNREQGLLLDSLRDSRKMKAKSRWANLSHLFINNPSRFSSEFKKSIQMPQSPLPRSLVVGGRDVRKVSRIQGQWVNRFKPTQPPSPSSVNRDFQSRVADQVEKNQVNLDYEPGCPSYDPALNGPYSVKEIKAARDKSEFGKSPSDDDVLNEMLKRGGPNLLVSLTLLVNLLWLLEVTPLAWKIVVLKPMYKKGSLLDPHNYRPIAFLSNLFKLYERVIDQRIRAVLCIALEQCGFRPGFSTEVALLRLSLIIQHQLAAGRELWLAFLDLEQAFERAWRVGILYQLWVSGVRGKCWRVIREMLSNISGFVRSNYGDTKKFGIGDGVLQGSVLAAILFIVFINPLIEALRPYSPSIRGLTLAPELFADDLCLIATHEQERSLLIMLCIVWTDKWRSSVKPSKSGLLTLAHSPPAAGRR